jgi:hypothetical protein
MPAAAKVCHGKRRPGSILRCGAMSGMADHVARFDRRMAGEDARQSSISAATCCGG